METSAEEGGKYKEVLGQEVLSEEVGGDAPLLVVFGSLFHQCGIVDCPV